MPKQNKRSTNRKAAPASPNGKAREASGRTAVFPGTFDPFTNGHLDLTKRAARLFDRVVVAVASNPDKGTLFSTEERVEMIRRATRTLRRVEVVDFDDLVVECAKRVDALVMIRGLRAVSDFEFEFQMALMNRRLSRGVEVAFLMPSQQYTYLNSTLVKEVAGLGGSIRGLVPRNVEDQLRARISKKDAARPRPAPRAATPVASSRPASTGRPQQPAIAAVSGKPASPARAAAGNTANGGNAASRRRSARPRPSARRGG